MRGQVFETWKYLMSIAEDVGFGIETYFGSEIINHFIRVPRGERINTDWVLVLNKRQKYNYIFAKKNVKNLPFFRVFSIMSFVLGSLLCF